MAKACGWPTVRLGEKTVTPSTYARDPRYETRSECLREATSDVVKRHCAPLPQLGASLSLMEGLEIEAIAQNHLGDQMIRGVRHADAQSKIHFPFRREVQIDGRKDLLLLLSDGKKIRGGTDRAIVFEPGGDFFREVVANFKIRRKNEALVNTVAMK